MVARIAVCVTNAHPRAFQKPSGNPAWSKEVVGTRLSVAVRTPQHNTRHAASYRKRDFSGNPGDALRIGPGAGSWPCLEDSAELAREVLFLPYRYLNAK
jgi:hypothetical protein